MSENATVAVIGLGYVGLPLAIAFGRKMPTIGFDLSVEKIESYQKCIDPSGEVSAEDLRSARQLQFTTNPVALGRADCVIVAVPTPIDSVHNPDFHPLVSASESVGRHMKTGATVVYESTVYPGATEEVCVPVLEKYSGKAWKRDFNVGYSPERINPGDKNHTLTKIVKVVSGDTAETLEKVAQLYGSIVEAGVYRASSIRVAEAAKVIENTQRDINIALMNELAILFGKIGLDTVEVLKAAETKWNFVPFRPGLVGGHCIGVDPYYLTYKAEMVGYHPQVILAGRRINDGMGKYVAEQTVKQMIQDGGSIKGAVVNVLGLTFKENCPDLRNSRVMDLIEELRSYGIQVFVHDPVAGKAEAKHEYAVDLVDWGALPNAGATVLAVPHQELLARPISDYAAKTTRGGCVVDVKSRLDADAVRAHGLRVWRL
jgi:UDP-N-acetyl-D-galactosamine dehydrogenase